MDDRKKSTGIAAVAGAAPEQQSGSVLELVRTEYARLQARVDAWFSNAAASFPDSVACSAGCQECCRGLFDITLLDAARLQEGFALLPDSVRDNVRDRAREILRDIRRDWPDFSPPYILNTRPDEEWDRLPSMDEHAPCLLLDSDGRCLLYDYRPMTCRLHGLPLVDRSGEIMEHDGCTKNFTGRDPLAEPGLHGDFTDIFSEEALLGALFYRELLGKGVRELDTFIPAALLIDFAGFDWQEWVRHTRLEHEPSHADVEEYPHPDH